MSVVKGAGISSSAGGGNEFEITRSISTHTTTSGTVKLSNYSIGNINTIDIQEYSYSISSNISKSNTKYPSFTFTDSLSNGPTYMTGSMNFTGISQVTVRDLDGIRWRGICETVFAFVGSNGTGTFTISIYPSDVTLTFIEEPETEELMFEISAYNISQLLANGSITVRGSIQSGGSAGSGNVSQILKKTEILNQTNWVQSGDKFKYELSVPDVYDTDFIPMYVHDSSTDKIGTYGLYPESNPINEILTINANIKPEEDITIEYTVYREVI